MELEGVKFITPHDKYKYAILGLCYDDNVMVYDFEKTVRITMEVMDLDYGEALEYVEFNIAGSKGEGFWKMVHTYNEEDFDEYL